MSERPAPDPTPRVRILPTIRKFWTGLAASHGRVAATRTVVKALWEFLRDSNPARLRQRYGDAGYDWDHRVNTTSAAVGWRDRLLGEFHSAYQPTDPAAFREMLDYVREQGGMDYSEFTFVDLGSGKGRTLLMASDYPFRRIVGVELLPSLERIAQENLRRYKCESQQCFALESVCADATTFPLPQGALLLYLFNPFPESELRQFLRHLDESLKSQPRAVFLLYHNPLLEYVLTDSGFLHKVGGTHQYSVFRG